MSCVIPSQVRNRLRTGCHWNLIESVTNHLFLLDGRRHKEIVGGLNHNDIVKMSRNWRNDWNIYQWYESPDETKIARIKNTRKNLALKYVVRSLMIILPRQLKENESPISDKFSLREWKIRRNREGFLAKRWYLFFKKIMSRKQRRKLPFGEV